MPSTATVDSNPSSEHSSSSSQHWTSPDEADEENARKCLKQLHREHVVGIRRVREEEQRKAQLALKDLRSRLHRDKAREMEILRETLTKRSEAEAQALLTRKDLELRRLRGDVDHLKRELKQAETSSTPEQRRWATEARRHTSGAKQGLSVSARDFFDAEHHKLQQEIRELQTAKRHLDTELTQAKEREKQVSFHVSPNAFTLTFD